MTAEDTEKDFRKISQAEEKPAGRWSTECTTLHSATCFSIFTVWQNYQVHLFKLEWIQSLTLVTCPQCSSPHAYSQLGLVPCRHGEVPEKTDGWMNRLITKVRLQTSQLNGHFSHTDIVIQIYNIWENGLKLVGSFKFILSCTHNLPRCVEMQNTQALFKCSRMRL